MRTCEYPNMRISEYANVRISEYANLLLTSHTLGNYRFSEFECFTEASRDLVCT